MSSITVIGFRGEHHTELVVRELRDRGLSVRVLELGLNADRYSISGSPSAPVISTEAGDFCRETLDGPVILLDFVVRDRPFVRPDGLEPFALREWNAIFDCALRLWSRESGWLLQPRNRDLQLLPSYAMALAQEFGAKVPATSLLAGDAELQLPAERLLAKAINPWEEIREGLYFNSRQVSQSEVIRLREAHPTSPLQLQAYVPHRREHRLYVVRNSAVAVEVYAPRQVDDFRALTRTTATAQIVEPSKDSLVWARRLMAALDISYCCFDIALSDTDGQEYLIDVNPDGSWGYLDKDYQVSITQVMIDEVLDGHENLL